MHWFLDYGDLVERTDLECDLMDFDCFARQPPNLRPSNLRPSLRPSVRPTSVLRIADFLFRYFNVRFLLEYAILFLVYIPNIIFYQFVLNKVISLNTDANLKTDALKDR